MSAFFHLHLYLSLTLIWILGAIACFAYEVHWNNNPALSGDTRLPPVLNALIAFGWPVVLLALIIVTPINAVRWVIGKIKGTN